jgi:hypothetical protein
VFTRLRWPRTDGKPVCPGCGCEICYDCRRSPETTRWRCKACRADFSITSGTLFAWHKLPLKTYLMAIAAFCVILGPRFPVIGFVLLKGQTELNHLSDFPGLPHTSGAPKTGQITS